MSTQRDSAGGWRTEIRQKTFATSASAAVNCGGEDALREAIKSGDAGLDPEAYKAQMIERQRQANNAEYLDKLATIRGERRAALKEQRARALAQREFDNGAHGSFKPTPCVPDENLDGSLVT